LLSYSPRDNSFNVSGSAPENGPARNWIGPVGAYLSDVMFQVFGFAAFLLPAALVVLGWRWFRSRPLDSQAATLIGYALLLLSLPCLFGLLKFLPEVRGAIPPGGLVGQVTSAALLASLNRGAYLVAPAMLVVAIFMTTRFSFAGAHAWASGPNGPIGKVEKLGVLQKAVARWHAWRDEREERQMQRRLEENRISGRKPVVQQAFGSGAVASASDGVKTIALDDESEIFDQEEIEKDGEKREAPKRKEPIVFVQPEKPEKLAVKKSGDPKIAKADPN
jgi:DNA segregation ATPase FtsK/SpoIIIE, S-DNA-T family